MARLKCVDQLLDDFCQQRPMRGGSLIISIFGDSIAQHGGSVWLGSLIEALEPFGLNQRLVRTSVYRLIQDNWLESSQIGRRSYYSFTEFGLRQYQKTARRIYAGSSSEWDGQWMLVLLSEVADDIRDELRRELRWLGYGALSAGLLARPGADRRSLDETLLELGVTDQVVVFSSRTEELASREALKRLSRECWKLDELEARYSEFLGKFRPVLAALKKTKALDADQAFQLRTLLIHEYRRILLKDTALPTELLPNNWAGTAALHLTANIYRLVSPIAESYLMSNMETADGTLPKPSAGFYSRFGGL